MWGALTCSKEQHHYGNHPMTPLELETTGGLVRNDDRDPQDDKRKADNDSVDDLAKLILRLVDLVEPVHDREHQQ